MTQEDIIKRYHPGWQDCARTQNKDKGHAALVLSGRLAQTALASIPARNSVACTPEAYGLELRDRLPESGPQASVVACGGDRIQKAPDTAFRGTVEERAAGLDEGSLQPRRFSQRQATKIAIKANGRIIFVDLDDVIAVEAEGNYVSLRRQSDSYLLRESITTMAEILKLYGFIRIHRSVLVNSSFVEQIQSRPTGGYGLRARGGKEYTVTRTYKNNLKWLAAAWIGTDILFDE